MEVNKGDRMVLNTIPFGGWELGDNWAEKSEIKPDELLVVSEFDEDGVEFGLRSHFVHPPCKFALVENNNERL